MKRTIRIYGEEYIFEAVEPIDNRVKEYIYRAEEFLNSSLSFWKVHKRGMNEEEMKVNFPEFIDCIVPNKDGEGYTNLAIVRDKMYKLLEHGTLPKLDGKAGIYMITVRKNKKVYIGSSKYILQRWKNHVYNIKRKDRSEPFYDDVVDIADMKFEVLEYLPDNTPSQELHFREKECILKYRDKLGADMVYNINLPTSVESVEEALRRKITNLEGELMDIKAAYKKTNDERNRYYIELRKTQSLLGEELKKSYNGQKFVERLIGVQLERMMGNMTDERYHRYLRGCNEEFQSIVLSEYKRLWHKEYRKEDYIKTEAIVGDKIDKLLDMIEEGPEDPIDCTGKEDE